ncbi:MAG: alpha/beta hydrolase [Gammaproteobacteria bacterium]
MPEPYRIAAWRHWRYALLLLLLWLNLTARAHASPVQQSFVHDPVFNARVRLLQAGRQHDSVIVLVHGLNASADVWQPFIPALSKYFHVLAFDLPGFGESSKGNKLYSPDNYVTFMHKLFARLNIKRVILAGHSLGGNIALRYAATYPQQVRRLVLIDAAGILHRLVYTEFLTHFGIRVLPRFYPQQRQDLTSLASNLFAVLTDYSPLMDVGERYMLSQPDLRQRFLGGAPPAIAAYAMAMANFSPVIDHFSIPTLLLWGGQDHVAPLRTAHLLAANFDNAGLIVLPGAGHSPLHDDPAAIKTWLLQFATASPLARDRLLANHRYRITYRAPDSANQIGRCHNSQHKVFTGDYRDLIIDHCRDIQLRDLRARSILIENSVVHIENCRLRSQDTSLRIRNSSVTMTACHIAGNPAIKTAGSKLDIAGSHLRSDRDSIIADPKGTTSTVLFSVSELVSQGDRQYVHGPMQLAPGQGL